MVGWTFGPKSDGVSYPDQLLARCNAPCNGSIQVLQKLPARTASI